MLSVIPNTKNVGKHRIGDRIKEKSIAPAWWFCAQNPKLPCGCLSRKDQHYQIIYENLFVQAEIFAKCGQENLLDGDVAPDG